MRVQFNFPNGYSADMTHARELNEFDHWVHRKFGDRIRDLIADDFTLDIADTHFIADFTYEDDANAFLKLFGGRVCE